MTQSISIIGIFKVAISKKESKLPYLVAYLVANFFMVAVALHDYLSLGSFSLPVREWLNANALNVGQTPSGWIIFYSMFLVIYFLFFVPVIQVGNAWLGLRSIRNIPNEKYDCFKLKYFYQPIFGLTLLVRFLVIGLVYLVFGKISYGASYFLGILILPFLVLTFLQFTDRNAFLKSCRFGLFVCIRHFFKICIFLIVILILNVLALLSVIGWVWIAPITSRAWGGLYQSLLDQEAKR